MAELIRRDLLIKRIHKAQNERGHTYRYGLEVAEKIIKEIPEAEPCTGCPKDNCKWRH